MLKSNKCIKKLTVICAAAAIVCPSVFCACKKDDGADKQYYFDAAPTYAQYVASGSETLTLSGNIMGTDAVLRIADKDNFATEESYMRATALWEDVTEFLITVNASISTTVETSCIAKYNACAAGDRVELDKTAYEVLTLAQKLYADTEGYYNPAVYNSERIFGFYPDKAEKPKNLPKEDTVNRLCALSKQFANVNVVEEEGKYYAVKPAQTVEADNVVYDLKIDLGGVGKGYCADKIDGMCREAGLEYGYFGFGSSSLAFRARSVGENHTYNVKVRDPRVAGGYYAAFAIKDKCLSTSGDYEKYYETDGGRYCHIIDPTTGAPIKTGVASVTVVGGTAADDDAISTALMAMGKQKAVEYINARLSGRTVVMAIVEEDGVKIVTNRPQDIKIENSAYKVINTVDGDGKIVLN